MACPGPQGEGERGGGKSLGNFTSKCPEGRDGIGWALENIETRCEGGGGADGPSWIPSREEERAGGAIIKSIRDDKTRFSKAWGGGLAGSVLKYSYNHEYVGIS